MILVTGAAGFIGSNLVAALEVAGAEVAACDYPDDPEKEKNLAKRRLAARVAPEELTRFLADNKGGIEAVYHMGAISSTTETDVDLLVRVNFGLSLQLWDWCTEAEVPFLYASSAATYGDGAQGFDDDGSLAALQRLTPLNAYGWSKHLFDMQVARLIADGEPVPPRWAGLKFFNVYGPNEYHKGAQQSVVPQIHARAAKGEPARLFKSHNPDYPDGGQMRDFIWVDDCVDVMTWLGGADGASGLYNVGTGKARSFADLATAVFRALGRNAEIEYVPTPEAIRDKYQYFTEARMERLAAAGYAKPFTALEDGVAAYVTGYLATDDPYR